MKNRGDYYSQNCGFSFCYRNGHLSHSRSIDPNRRNYSEGNSDNLFVLCGDCDEWMDFYEGSGDLNGYWECPCCGERVREKTAYTKLDRENNSNSYNEYYN